MAARLGNVIYWIACGLAPLWLTFATWADATTQDDGPRWGVVIGVGGVGAAIIWGAGRACRYVLAGR